MEMQSFEYDYSTKKLAVSFLTSIPLSVKEACANCRIENQIKQDNFSCCDDDSFVHTGGNDSIDKMKHLDIPMLRDGQFIQRSQSSTVDTMLQTVKHERHYSFTEVISGRLLPSHDFSGVKGQQHHGCLMQMKFISENILLTNRLFFLEPVHHSPCIVFSVVPFVKESHKSKGTANIENTKNKTCGVDCTNGHNIGNATAAKNQVISYKDLLNPSKLVCDVKLDCAEWMFGKHRTVLALNSYMVSLISYTKSSELKRDLNQQFKTSFPMVNITLSKLRSLERQMHRMAKVYRMQTGIFSCAKLYFERLVFSGLVNKINRQQVAAACFLLSAKVHGDLKSDEIQQVVSSLEHSFKSTKFGFLAIEFSVFAALKFSLLPLLRHRNMSGDQVV